MYSIHKTRLSSIPNVLRLIKKKGRLRKGMLNIAGELAGWRGARWLLQILVALPAIETFGVSYQGHM